MLLAVAAVSVLFAFCRSFGILDGCLRWVIAALAVRALWHRRLTVLVWGTWLGAELGYWQYETYRRTLGADDGVPPIDVWGWAIPNALLWLLVSGVSLYLVRTLFAKSRSIH